MNTGTVAVTRNGEEGTWLITLEGEHDIATSALREVATDAVDWRTCAHVVIDLSHADFIDASVIGWLLRSHQVAAITAGVVSVVEGPPSGLVARVVGVLGLRHELSCHATRQDAFADPRVSASPVEAALD